MVHLTLSARDALKPDRAVVAVGARLDDGLLWFCDVPQANASQRDNPNPSQYNRDPECSHVPFLSCGRAIEPALVAHPRMSHKSGTYRLGAFQVIHERDPVWLHPRANAVIDLDFAYRCKVAVPQAIAE